MLESIFEMVGGWLGYEFKDELEEEEIQEFATMAPLSLINGYSDQVDSLRLSEFAHPEVNNLVKKYVRSVVIGSFATGYAKAMQDERSQ